MTKEEEQDFLLRLAEPGRRIPSCQGMTCEVCPVGRSRWARHHSFFVSNESCNDTARLLLESKAVIQKAKRYRKKANAESKNAQKCRRRAEQYLKKAIRLLKEARQ
jgi:hypothetical protein